MELFGADHTMKIEISENCQELPRVEMVQFFKDLDAALRVGFREGSNNKESYGIDSRDFIDSVYFSPDVVYMHMYAYNGSYAEDKITPKFINELSAKLAKVDLILESITITAPKDGWNMKIKSVVK